MEPDYKVQEIELSMAHRRDPNVLLKLDAAAIEEFDGKGEIVELNQRIATLTKKIMGKPEAYKEVAIERSKLYSKKARALQVYKTQFVQKWWDTSYDEYVAGNNFSERDTTPLFEIYRRYIPERSRLSESLFKMTTLDSEIGRQCLEDMVSLCKSTDRVVYYPGISPINGRCPTCSKSMTLYMA
ncbi:hypothetical protein N7495_001724 [Penicillium taxi]|uniref:uncharacterized protein n=1 Tax=Penicillium taxi TaxID=168475 RepID=UPI002544D9EE|nr:uncharacterized protein N7495_001724 [Penicillium taxi]KAJ5909042.1 hypothetical protein N7495_001724 [Penicillium taxi]